MVRASRRQPTRSHSGCAMVSRPQNLPCWPTSASSAQTTPRSTCSFRKSHSDELKSAIASAQAAEETLHFKGNPTSQEGKECRQSMVTKQNTEGQCVSRISLVRSLGALASSFPVARNSHLSGSRSAWKMPPNRYSTGSIRSFMMATLREWPQVLNKAKDGSPSALGQVGYYWRPTKPPGGGGDHHFHGSWEDGPGDP